MDGVSYDLNVAEAGAAATGGTSPAASSGPVTEVKSELAAKIFKVETSVGTQVSEGDLLVILEALKMEIEIKAPCAGVVKELPFSVGQAVSPGETIAAIG